MRAVLGWADREPAKPEGAGCAAVYGIRTLRKKAESVTHVSGTGCHLCLGPLRMLTGSCLCQAVAYEVDADPGPFVHCHCRTCPKVDGSAFLSVMSVPRQSFRWVRGGQLIRW